MLYPFDTFLPLPVLAQRFTPGTGVPTTLGTLYITPLSVTYEMYSTHVIVAVAYNGSQTCSATATMQPLLSVRWVWVLDGS